MAQCAVNMYQGELYGYAHYIQRYQMQPANVAFIWVDVICKYWKWARNAGLLKECSIKPALSVMHAKAHNWTCQVIWGGRWQTDSACSTGEEVEQINSYMSRCSNTTKYMLPEGRDELLTEHAMGWNKRKILNGVVAFKKVLAGDSSFVEVLEELELQEEDDEVSESSSDDDDDNDDHHSVPT